MGFDNECILNIQSLPGEYFCPVCRLLVLPNEALQAQCTHLYCKPCMAYTANSTRACPYDGYLVTELDAKVSFYLNTFLACVWGRNAKIIYMLNLLQPLPESNKALADTINKIAVHCLYHRSGCTWQGPLLECVTHCSGCAFGNSPVVCNRCALQIVHRQVQEHAQTCPVSGEITFYIKLILFMFLLTLVLFTGCAASGTAHSSDSRSHFCKCCSYRPEPDC